MSDAEALDPGFPIWSWYPAPQHRRRALVFLGSDARHMVDFKAVEAAQLEVDHVWREATSGAPDPATAAAGWHGLYWQARRKS